MYVGTTPMKSPGPDGFLEVDLRKVNDSLK